MLCHRIHGKSNRLNCTMEQCAETRDPSHLALHDVVVRVVKMARVANGREPDDDVHLFELRLCTLQAIKSLVLRRFGNRNIFFFRCV